MRADDGCDDHAGDVGASGRRFVLASDPTHAAPTLTPEDVQHALRVLRVAPGDRLVGLDGKGAAWPLVVAEAGRRTLELTLAGAPTHEPAPGTRGAPPAIEVGVSLPRGSRAEDLLQRLTQLGVARVTPLVTERSPPHAREAGEARRERLARAGREAAKQCGRLWFPEVGPTTSLAAWLASRGGAPAAWLDPDAEASLLGWDAPRAAPQLALAVGPEGGFAPEEERLLVSSGAFRARLGGHVLRLETAAEAAVAVLATMALDASSALRRGLPAG